MPYPSKVDAETIVNAAVSLVESEGAAALSMRSVAERLGLTVSSLYRYFADRAALESAIGAYAATQLEAVLCRAVEKPQPFERAIRGYVQFARNRPVLYAVLLAPGPYRAETDGSYKRLWNTFLRIVGTVTGNPDDTDAAVAVWSFLHGFVALEQSGKFGKSGPRRGFETGMAALLQGLSERAKSRPDAS